MTDIKNQIKATVLGENSYYAQNWVRGAFFCPKPTYLKFSLNLFIRFFWNYNWWQPLKVGRSDCFGFWRKICTLLKIWYMVQLLESGFHNCYLFSFFLRFPEISVKLDYTLMYSTISQIFQINLRLKSNTYELQDFIFSFS